MVVPIRRWTLHSQHARLPAQRISEVSELVVGQWALVLGPIYLPYYLLHSTHATGRCISRSSVQGTEPPSTNYVKGSRRVKPISDLLLTRRRINVTCHPHCPKRATQSHQLGHHGAEKKHGRELEIWIFSPSRRRDPGQGRR